MDTHRSRTGLRLLYLFAALLLLALGGCASMARHEPIRVHVVGLDPLEGEGLEVRFKVKLRLQNPNDTPIDYDGLAVDLDLNGRPFATGVSNERGTLPRFGETVIGIPVSVSALAAVRQAFGLAHDGTLDNVPYVLHCRLGGGPFGVADITESGTLSLPGLGNQPGSGR